MQRADFDKYLKNEEKWYNPQILITILEDNLKKDFTTLYNEVKYADIKWQEEDIIKFLTTKNYKYNPNTLEYLKSYIAIIQYKVLSLFDIIEKLSLKKLSLINKKLISLDIKLNESKDINKEDIIRLIIPTVYNYQLYQEKICQINDLNTYLQNIENLDYPSYHLQSQGLGNVPLSKEQEEIKRRKILNNIKENL